MDHLFGFTGRALDGTTGLQNNLSRWYDFKMHQWLSLDPSGFAGQDQNLYRYVVNSPATFTDPSGLEWQAANTPWIWVAGADGDTLEDLAIIIDIRHRADGQNPESFKNDWVGIWPLPTDVHDTRGLGLESYSTWLYWNKWQFDGQPVADEGAGADVSNLMACVRIRANHVLLAANREDARDGYADAIKRFMRQSPGRSKLRTWGEGSPHATAADAIAKLSGQGATPIESMVIGAHWRGNDGIGQLDSGEPFTVGDLFSYDDPALDNTTNTFEQASQRKGPPMTWFTRNARIWVAGCLTGVDITWNEPRHLVIGPNEIIINGPGGFASGFADRVLRGGAVAYGTDRFLVGNSRSQTAFWADDISREPNVTNIHNNHRMRSLTEIITVDPNSPFNHWQTYEGGQ